MTPYEAPKIGPKVQLQTAFLVLCLDPGKLYSCSAVAAGAAPCHYARLRDSLSQFARSNSFCGYRGSAESGFVRAANGRRVPAYAGAVWQRHVGRQTLQAALDIALVLEALPEDTGFSAADLARRSCPHGDQDAVALRRRLLGRLWRFCYGESNRADQPLSSTAWRDCLPEATRLCCPLWRSGGTLPLGLTVTKPASSLVVAPVAPAGLARRDDRTRRLWRRLFSPQPLRYTAWAVFLLLGLLSVGRFFWVQEKPPPAMHAWVSATHIALPTAVSESGGSRGSSVGQTVLRTPFGVTSAASAQPDLVLGFVPMSP